MHAPQPIRSVALVLLAGLLLPLAPVGHGRQADRATFMRKKLEHSQKILEGLTLERHALVARHAEDLGALSEAAAWQVLPTDDYLRFSQEFHRLTDDMAAEARQENIDGATLAYVQMTLNCVNCHKYVRIQMKERP